MIRDFRGLLVQPEQASSCTKKILKPRDKNFDAKLRDFFAEVMAVVDLGRRGYARFELVTPVRGFPTPDFKAEKDGNSALIEVKNMRVPDSINEAAFAHWNAKRAELPNSFNFDVQLVHRGNGDELSAEQTDELFKAIDGLPSKARPGSYAYDLGTDLNVTFVVRNGSGQMMWRDFVAVGFESDLTGMRRVLIKTFDLTDEALKQLYSPVMRATPGTLRVLYIRWNVPDRMFLDAQTTADRVQAALTQLFRPDYPELEFLVTPYL
ncbi:MAG: hypothetical protein WB919_23615 [Candidatus Sulfotelmatobacter sp.]